jgi:hypothetical protein
MRLIPDDDVLLVLDILQGDANHALLFIGDFGEVPDIAFLKQNGRNALLESRSGHIHGFMAGGGGVADSGEHICNDVGRLHKIGPPFAMCTSGLHHPRNLTLVGQFAEAKTADAKFSHVGVRTSAKLAAVVVPR